MNVCVVQVIAIIGKIIPDASERSRSDDLQFYQISII